MRGSWLRRSMLRMRRLSTACGLRRQAPAYLIAKHHLGVMRLLHAASVMLGRFLLTHCNHVRPSLMELSQSAKKGSMELKGLVDPFHISSACH